MLNEHMNSLTDELCEGFWPRPRTKKEKKQPSATPRELVEGEINIPEVRRIYPDTSSESIKASNEMQS